MMTHGQTEQFYKWWHKRKKQTKKKKTMEIINNHMTISVWIKIESLAIKQITIQYDGRRETYHRDKGGGIQWLIGSVYCIIIACGCRRSHIQLIRQFCWRDDSFFFGTRCKIQNSGINCFSESKVTYIVGTTFENVAFDLTGWQRRSAHARQFRLIVRFVGRRQFFQCVRVVLEIGGFVDGDPYAIHIVQRLLPIGGLLGNCFQQTVQILIAGWTAALRTERRTYRRLAERTVTNFIEYIRIFDQFYRYRCRCGWLLQIQSESKKKQKKHKFLIGLHRPLTMWWQLTWHCLFQMNQFWQNWRLPRSMSSICLSSDCSILETISPNRSWPPPNDFGWQFESMMTVSPMHCHQLWPAMIFVRTQCLWWPPTYHSPIAERYVDVRAAHAIDDGQNVATDVVRIEPCAEHDFVRSSGIQFCQSNGNGIPCGRNSVAPMDLLPAHAIEKMYDVRRHISTDACMPSHCTNEKRTNALVSCPHRHPPPQWVSISFSWNPICWSSARRIVRFLVLTQIPKYQLALVPGDIRIRLFPVDEIFNRFWCLLLVRVQSPFHTYHNCVHIDAIQFQPFCFVEKCGFRFGRCQTVTFFVFIQNHQFHIFRLIRHKTKFGYECNRMNGLIVIAQFSCKTIERISISVILKRIFYWIPFTYIEVPAHIIHQLSDRDTRDGRPISLVSIAGKIDSASILRATCSVRTSRISLSISMYKEVQLQMEEQR